MTHEGDATIIERHRLEIVVTAVGQLQYVGAIEFHGMQQRRPLVGLNLVTALFRFILVDDVVHRAIRVARRAIAGEYDFAVESIGGAGILAKIGEHIVFDNSAHTLCGEVEFVDIPGAVARVTLRTVGGENQLAAVSGGAEVLGVILRAAEIFLQRFETSGIDVQAGLNPQFGPVIHRVRRYDAQGRLSLVLQGLGILGDCGLGGLGHTFRHVGERRVIGKVQLFFGTHLFTAGTAD